MEEVSLEDLLQSSRSTEKLTLACSYQSINHTSISQTFPRPGTRELKRHSTSEEIERFEKRPGRFKPFFTLNKSNSVHDTKAMFITVRLEAMKARTGSDFHISRTYCVGAHATNPKINRFGVRITSYIFSGEDA